MWQQKNGENTLPSTVMCKRKYTLFQFYGFVYKDDKNIIWSYQVVTLGESNLRWQAPLNRMHSVIIYSYHNFK